MAKYTKTLWRDNQAPPINANNLNHMEDGIYTANELANSASDSINGVKNDVNNIKSDVNTLQSSVNNTKDSLSKVDKRVDDLESHKNTVDNKLDKAINDNKAQDGKIELNKINLDRVDSETKDNKAELDRLSNTITSIDTSVALVNEEKGSAIILNDSAKRELKGLKLFGKSWQDKEPTIEEPQEIHSIDNATVDVYEGNCVATTGRHIIEEQKIVALSFSPTVRDTIQFNVTWLKGYSEYADFTFRNSETGKSDAWSGTIVDGVVKRKLDALGVGTFDQIRVYSGSSSSNKNKKIIVSNILIYNSDNLQSLEIPYKLNGVPVSHGGNYTDENGQDWISDYVDFEKGVLVRNCLELNLNTRDMNNYNSFPGWKFSRGVFDLRKLVGGDYNLSIQTLSSVGGKYNINTTSDNNILWVDETSLNDKNQNELVKLALDVHVVFCGDRTVEEIPLSESELQAYKQLLTLYPYTTILNDKGAYMDVKYVADTKNYIDNKFDELKSALIATGGNV